MRWIRRIVVVALVILFTSGLVAVALSAKDYGTPAFWAAPDRINYCGRRYDRGPGSVHGTARYFVHRDTGSTAGVRWQRIGRTFVLRPIYATVLLHPMAKTLCAGSLFVPIIGRGNYVEYELSGGP